LQAPSCVAPTRVVESAARVGEVTAGRGLLGVPSCTIADAALFSRASEP